MFRQHLFTIYCIFLFIEDDAIVKKILMHLDLWIPLDHDPSLDGKDRNNFYIQSHRNFEWWEAVNQISCDEDFNDESGQSPYEDEYSQLANMNIKIPVCRFPEIDLLSCEKLNTYLLYTAGGKQTIQCEGYHNKTNNYSSTHVFHVLFYLKLFTELLYSVNLTYTYIASTSKISYD